MKDFHFLDWQVYRDAKKVAAEIFEITKKFPAHLRIDFGSQINRSVFSILLNIAEGSGKNSDKDFIHFLNIAMGSLYETVAGLDFGHDIGLISDEQWDDLRQQLLGIARQMGGMRKKLAK